MLPKINPTTTRAWHLLEEHCEEMRRIHLKDLFEEDNERYKKYSLAIPNILWDYSKNLITDKTIQLLLQLSEECDVKTALDAMFNAEKINETENRAVLHTALRNFSGKSVFLEGKDIMKEVNEVLKKMENFCSKVHSGDWKGYTGKKIKYIVNIGIGGSDLGPVMVTEALKPYWIEGIKTYFDSNIDASQIAEVLKKITPD